VSTPATSAISTAATELGRQLSLQELYGDDFSKVTMKQGPYSNTCYLLATLGGIFHLPEDKAKAVLSRIKIYENGNQYQVQFPGQKKVITVTKEELENTFTVQSRKPGGKPWQATRVTSNAPGVRIIEAAYLKTIPSERVGYFSTPDLALQNIFGIPAYEATNIHNGKDLSGKVDDGNGYEEVVDIYGNVQKLKIADQMEHRAGQFESTHEGRHDLFKDFTLHANNDPSFADIATAIPIGGAHYYTIRLFESTPAQIVLADPFDFDNNFDSEKSIKVPFDVFMQNYNIEGIRLQLN
jgi:predicted RecA/RadA family phage recombinase